MMKVADAMAKSKSGKGLSGSEPDEDDTDETESESGSDSDEIDAMKLFEKATTVEAKAKAMKLFIEACGAY